MSYDPQPGGGTVAVKDDGTTTVGTATALNFVDTGSLQFVVTDLGAGVAQVVGNVLAAGGPPTGAAGGDLTGTYPNPTIGTNKVQNSQFRQGAARSVVGVTGNATANVADIAGGGAGTVPIDSGSALAFGVLTRILQNLTLEGDISPAQITADQNDYNPASLSTSAVLRLDEDAARAITGIAGGSDGRILILFNIGAFNLTLTNASASSTAANRFDFGRDVVLQPKNAAFLWYDSTSSRWRLVPGEAVDAASATASLRTLGSGAAQACAGNDSRLSDSRAPTGSAGGDLAGSTYPNPVVANSAITNAKQANMAALTVKVNSTNSSAAPSDLAFGTDGFVLRRNGTALETALITDSNVNASNKDGASGTASMRTLGTGAAQACAGNDSRLSDSRAPTGSAGGDLAGTYPNPTVAQASGAFAITGDISPTQITANQNDYNPTSLSTSTTLRLTTDADRTITGLAGGADGRLITIYNIGSNPITLADESASSTAANRFSFGFAISILPKRGLVLEYDSTASRWKPLTSALDQVVQSLTDGATITPSVDAGKKMKVTLGGNRTLAAPTGAKIDGVYIEMAVFQDGTGSRTLTPNTGAGAYRATEVAFPTLSTAAGKCDYLLWRYNGTDDRWDLMDFRKAA